MSNPVAIALTVDVEGEWFELPGEQGSFDVARVLEAVRHLESLLEIIEVKVEIKVPVTWFIRCDDSVAVATGRASGLLQSLDSFIQRRTDKGDEFGLHPHMYQFDRGKWVSETNPDRQVEQIERAAIAWAGYFGSVPKLSRMGEAVMNNSIADCLDKIGVEIDSSALSGRRRHDSGFQFDWTNTSASPYRPSQEDYRRPAANGELAHRYIEVPFSMLPIYGPQDKEAIKRYCNLAFFPSLIKSAIQNISRPEQLITVVHPHELLSSSQQHHLIAHDPNSLEANIQNMRDIFGGLDFTLLSARTRGFRE